MFTSKRWYCGYCFDGPHNPRLNIACIACGKRRDALAYTEFSKRLSKYGYAPLSVTTESFRKPNVLASHEQAPLNNTSATESSGHESSEQDFADFFGSSEPDTDIVSSPPKSVASSWTPVEESEALIDAAAGEFTSDLLRFEEIKQILIHIQRGNRISANEFERSCRRLLVHYSRALRRISHGAAEKVIVAMISRRSRYIAYSIRQELTSHLSAQSLDENLISRQQIGQYLQKLPDGYYSTSETESDDLERDWIDEVALSNYTSVKSFLFGHEAFIELRASLWYLADPTMSVRLESIFSEISNTRAKVLLFQANEDRTSWLKCAIEDYTGSSWDWWPLKHRQTNMQAGHNRLNWTCTCGSERYEDVPTCFAERLIKSFSTRSKPVSLPGTNDQTQQPLSTLTSMATVDADSSQRERGMPSDSFRTNPNSGIFSFLGLTKARHRGQMRSILPDDVYLYVLLGIPLWGDVRLEHIQITDLEDDKFFIQIRKAYIKVKGFLRFYLGIRKYAHCDFFKFEKFDENEFVALERNSVPAPENAHYQYRPKPVQKMPPISRHEFKKRFYRCYGKCLLGILGLRNPLHKCKMRCHTCPDAVHLVPKRLTPLETGGNAREEFWGLYVGEVISAITVVVYLILLLIAPFLFWFLWLFCWGHPGDLQNASVPLICTLGLIGVSSCGLFGGSLCSDKAV